MKRLLLCAGVLLALSGGASSAAGGPGTAPYTVTDLRPLVAALGVPANRVDPTAISQGGRIVGTWDDESFCHTTQSFLFTPATANSATGTMRDIGNFGASAFRATGVNDAGQVTVASENDIQCSRVAGFPFIWQDGALRQLDASGAANAINALGQAAGNAGGVATLWAGAGAQQLGGGSNAFAINDLGHVVGNSNGLPGATPYGDAFFWDGSMHDLGRLFDESTAFAINNEDVVAGESSQVNHFSHAFVYSGGAMHDIDCDTRGRAAFGCNGPDTGSSRADGINNAGQVVGEENGRAFLWDSTGGMVDLNTLVPTDVNDLLTNAVAINDSGQIIVTGASSSYLLTPAPVSSPPAPILTSPLDGASIVGTHDVHVAGSAEANAAVTVYVDGSPVGTLSADATGAFDSSVAVSYGTHTLAVSQTVGGVESAQTAARSIALAPAAPTLVSPADGASIVGTSDVHVAGSAEANAAVAVYVDGSPAGTLSADATGAFDSTVSLSYGTHAIAVSQTVGGVESPQSPAHAITVVPAAPLLTAPADGATVGSTTVPVTGTGVPFAHVDVSDGGVAVASATVDATGAFSTSASLGLGPHSLTATQTVGGETSAASGAHAVTVDIAPALTAPADGALFATSGVSVSGTALPNTAVHVFAGATDVATMVADATGAFAGTVTLADGAHSLTAKQVANGFVSSPSAARAITVDTTAPVLHLPASITTGNPVVTYTVTATDAIDPSPTVSCTPPSGSTFAVGTTRVDCTATDRAGNSSSGSFTVTVTAPKTPLQRLIEDANAIGNSNIKAHVRNLSQVGGNGYCSQLKVLASELSALRPQTATTADALDAVASLQRAAGCSR